MKLLALLRPSSADLLVGLVVATLVPAVAAVVRDDLAFASWPRP